MWITLCIFHFPILTAVDIFVEKKETYLHKKKYFVEKGDINSFLTPFSHQGVDNQCKASVGRTRIIWMK